MPTVLITGANRGIGLEFARQYATDGWRVFATCRSGDGLGDIGMIEGDVEGLVMDVADHGQIDAVAGRLHNEPIDVLVQNAGVMGPRRQPFGGTDYREWETAMRVNVFGPMKVAEAFAAQVGRSEQKRMAFISSRLASMTENTSGAYFIYRSSKAALNAVAKSLSINLAGAGITSIILHPGWVRTRMGGPDGNLDPAESVSALRKLIAQSSPADNGRFLNVDGAEIPW
ncbi:MAG: SDR family oxidoreductase [Rhodospirillales bacterium]|nr:SDR family oxidoreductase [Rhodospirillales bacterium]